MAEITAVFPHEQRRQAMAVNAYKQLQPQVPQQIGNTLTPEQIRQWQQITGEPYRFSPFYGYTNR